MKITGHQTQLVKLPSAPTLAGIPDKADQYTFITLQLRTDEGIEGIGITFFGGGLAATLKSAVDQLGALTVGEDPLRPEAVVEKLRGAAKGSGPKLVAKGFKQMKTQMALPGKTNIRIEADRMRRVRDAIGPDIDLMCDINQRWSVQQAISFGRSVEEVGLYWLEDVTACDDF